MNKLYFDNLGFDFVKDIKTDEKGKYYDDIIRNIFSLSSEEKLKKDFESYGAEAYRPCEEGPTSYSEIRG